jgi:CHAT domain-containing protein
MATALLMAKFYDLHIGRGLSPPAALKTAQAWLRTATGTDLMSYGEAAGCLPRSSGTPTFRSRQGAPACQSLSA